MKCNIERKVFGIAHLNFDLILLFCLDALNLLLRKYFCDISMRYLDFNVQIFLVLITPVVYFIV